MMKIRKDTLIEMDMLVTADQWSLLSLYSAGESGSAGSIILPAARTAEPADSPGGLTTAVTCIRHHYHAIIMISEQTLPPSFELE